MGSFLGFITSRFAGPLFGVVAILSLAGNGYQFISTHFELVSLHKQVRNLNNENADLILHNAILEANSDTLNAEIKTQNTAIDGMKSAAELSAAQAKANQVSFNVAADALDAQAAAIGKLPPLPAGADRCAAASVLIRDTLAGEHSK